MSHADWLITLLMLTLMASVLYCFWRAKKGIASVGPWPSACAFVSRRPRAAATSCSRRPGSGPSAVGASTTSAVVAGLVLIIVADGVFAVLFNILGI